MGERGGEVTRYIVRSDKVQVETRKNTRVDKGGVFGIRGGNLRKGK